MLIELHILQNFPPSNLNRDDIGQPKDSPFGGYRRARISSQCIKRATRLHPLFAEYTGVPTSQRTKLAGKLLALQLQTACKHQEDEAQQVALAFARQYSGKMDEKDKARTKTAALLYLGNQEIVEIAERLHAEWTQVLAEANTAQEEVPSGKRQGKKQQSTDGAIKGIVDALIKQTKNRTSAPDIALFGRMLADKPDTNIDAACQVAHAISTHAIERMEIDYFTAVDDAQDKNETGAGFLDVAYFNSACFYRYSCLDWSQLVTNLGGDESLARRTVEAYLRASEAAVPTGKKNGTAPQCRPSVMLAVVRNPRSVAWSLVNAFARPVNGKQDGIIADSALSMAQHFANLSEFYGSESLATLALATPANDIDVTTLPEMVRKAYRKSFKDWIETVTGALPGGA